jgi:CRP-like cAMP-binding protein
MATLTGILESLSGGSGVARRLDAGEILFTTGDSVRGLFVVERGQLRLLRPHLARCGAHVKRL